MIATDNLVFVHLHKSGGTFVNELLLRFAQAPRRIGYHLPYREAPDAIRHLPVIGTVRDPWGYYVSWFHFQRAMRRPNPLFTICSDGGTLGFEATVRNLIGLESDERRITALHAAVPETYRSNGLNLTKACVHDLRGCGAGFYTFLHDRMYAGSVLPCILRTDRIRRDLVGTMRQLGEPLPAIADIFADNVPDLNRSEHDPPHFYYDEDLRDLVTERDRGVIDRYGFAPPAP